MWTPTRKSSKETTTTECMQAMAGCCPRIAEDITGSWIRSLREGMSAAAAAVAWCVREQTGVRTSETIPASCSRATGRIHYPYCKHQPCSHIGRPYAAEHSRHRPVGRSAFTMWPYRWPYPLVAHVILSCTWAMGVLDWGHVVCMHDVCKYGSARRRWWRWILYD